MDSNILVELNDMFEELPNQNNEELEKSIDVNVERLLEKLKITYEQLSPEKQVVFGVFATYVYVIMLTYPESLPDIVQPIIELLDKMPLGTISTWITMMIAFVGSADGVRRIIVERLPFYKAYVQVFLLGITTEDEENISI